MIAGYVAIIGCRFASNGEAPIGGLDGAKSLVFGSPTETFLPLNRRSLRARLKTYAKCAAQNEQANAEYCTDHDCKQRIGDRG